MARACVDHAMWRERRRSANRLLQQRSFVECSSQMDAPGIAATRKQIRVGQIHDRRRAGGRLETWYHQPPRTAASRRTSEHGPDAAHRACRITQATSRSLKQRRDVWVGARPPPRPLASISHRASRLVRSNSTVQFAPVVDNARRNIATNNRRARRPRRSNERLIVRGAIDRHRGLAGQQAVVKNCGSDDSHALSTPRQTRASRSHPACGN